MKSNLRSLEHAGYSNLSSNFEDLQTINKKYPVWSKVVSTLSRNGDINTSMSEFLIDIINHTLEVFDSSASRNDEDYCERLEGEIDSQHFPNFPLRRERAFYEKTCNVEDENSLKFMCEKDFPSHSTLTPGLLIMTCACPKKIVYGFTLMTSGESPQMIFDLILSRFPTDYSPNIIYDNACKAKGRVQKTKWKFLMAFSMRGVVLRANNIFFDFFAQKISRIVTIKNWMEISDIKSGVGGRWGWGVRCLMANAI